MSRVLAVSSLALHVELFAKMVADPDQQCHPFGIAWFGDGCRVGLGPEFPGVAAAQNER
jgi:hypothetical protein